MTTISPVIPAVMLLYEIIDILSVVVGVVG